MEVGEICPEASVVRHRPAEQVPPQATPHPPQLAGSLAVSTHALPQQTMGLPQPGQAEPLLELPVVLDDEEELEDVAPEPPCPPVTEELDADAPEPPCLPMPAPALPLCGPLVQADATTTAAPTAPMLVRWCIRSSSPC